MNSGTQSNPDIYYRNGYVHVVFQDGISGNVLYRRGRLSTANLNETHPLDLLIYPNPATNIINITGLSKDTPFQIYTLAGKKITQGIVRHSSPSISIEDIKNGIYVIELLNKKIKFEKQ